VGIKINKAGQTRGVEDVPTVSGFVGYWPFTQNVLEYPVYEQPVEWGKEDDATDKLSFASSEGMRFQSGISVRYILNDRSVPDFYRDYKITDMSAFERRYLLPEVANAFITQARNYKAEELIGVKAEDFMSKTRTQLEERLAVMHVGVRHLGFIGTMVVPETVRSAIQQNVAMAQQARAAEAERKTAEAQALRDKSIAEGKASVRRTEAEADAAVSKARTDAAAYATTESAKADAEAVRLMVKQGNEAIELKRLEVQMELAKNWKGEQPHTIIGDVKGSGLMLQLPAIK
jgi:regulator of protease activity HflC (stomatin/prohibitin superfamily)